MLNVVIFGAPGSGKGTQSKLIAEKYNLAHVSTGDLLRQAIHNNTHEGVIAKSYIDKGELVPDEVIIGMLDAFMEKLPQGKGIIFDGYPRTVSQAETLMEMMKDHGTKVSVLLNLEVDEAELMDRLLKRAETEGRSDDNPETIKKRLSVYETQTLPVIEFYRKKRLYKPIKGVGEVTEIFDRISEVLNELK
ncbi:MULTISPECIES: adenylate kinase [unclassified Carboxylicivirga]|uniref:adenylate kinase n=1 Tax=Carboxylicivirga TaxID=1628153 RepID=UPI003D336A63